MNKNEAKKFNREELSDVKAGIRYLKPGLISGSDGIMSECCKNGLKATVMCMMGFEEHPPPKW